MVQPPFGTAEEKKWQVMDQKAVTRNPWYRVLESRVQMPDGRTTTYHILDFLKSAVGVVARRGDEILLIRQYRFIIDQFVWAIPSGGSEGNEDPRVAAERELEEETGYRAEQLTRIHSYFPSYGCGNQEFHLFLAEGIHSSPERFDRNEVLEVRWFPIREIKEMILAEHMVDGLSITPLLFLCAREGW